VVNRGYEFVGWTGTAVDAGKVVDSGSAGTEVTMDADYTLQANFRRVRSVIYVDDDSPNDLQANNQQVSGPGEDGLSCYGS
jgi:uncharacterized repeat protein (TIGR02543 family)